jgi:hypothetical protein
MNDEMGNQRGSQFQEAVDTLGWSLVRIRFRIHEMTEGGTYPMWNYHGFSIIKACPPVT